MISPLHIGTDGYLCSPLGIATNGYICLQDIIIDKPIEFPDQIDNFGGASGVSNAQLGQIRSLSKLRKHLRREDDEILIIIKTFMKCQ